ncbi:MAG TPA: hypothetical protein VJV23_13305 [Candidatus Polarisedimenticolia bacterium]|nr:hypothetical protein [Candidatus Polarisedimenticolia bacterium]
MPFAAVTLLVTLASAPAGEGASGAGPGPPRPPLQKGMVLGLFARDEPGFAERGIAELRALGVSSVSLVIPWVTPHVRSLEMAPRGDMSPTDDALAGAIRAARRAGMTVLLMPILYVDRMEEGEWRGTISPPDWTAWFAAYERFILHYARIAQREQVEYFAVGSELCSTESRREEWAVLIAGVRRVYAGKLTYSANWDHRRGIAFLDKLDLLGMNAYFELAGDDGKGGDSEEALHAAWGPIREEIEAWRRQTGLDIILTEVGYPSRAGGLADPWNYEAPGPPDPAAQLRGYRAFRRAWQGDPHLHGVYFYLWWGEGGPGDTGYTPRGKPAEAVVRDWYLGERVDGRERREP